MQFVIIIAFVLASGVHGQVNINRSPPMTSFAQCEAVREDEVKRFRRKIEEIHGALESFESRCEAPGLPI